MDCTLSKFFIIITIDGCLIKLSCDEKSQMAGVWVVCFSPPTKLLFSKYVLADKDFGEQPAAASDSNSSTFQYP